MELKGFDDNNLNGNSQTQSNKSEESKGNKKKWAGLIIGIAVVAGILVYDKVHTHTLQVKEEEQQISESELDAILADPHSARDYYLNTVHSEEYTNQAAADMIAHVIITGCKTSYESLRKYFDSESMKYLYDYLGGYQCEEWSMPPCSLQERGLDFEEYKITVSYREKYLVHMNLDSEHNPKSFYITKYADNESVVDDYNGKQNTQKEVKDHSNIQKIAESELLTETTSEEKK